MADRPETYLNQTEFSKQIGFTRQAISKAVGTGVLRQVEFEGNKYIDIESVLTKSYIKEARTKKTGQSLKTKTIPKKKVGQSKSKKKPQKKQAGQSFSSDVIGKIDGGRYFRGALRQAILERDNFTCVLCGSSAKGGNTLEVDHIVEYEDGGNTNLENGQTLCAECNKGKHSLKNITKNAEMISQYEFSKRVNVNRNRIGRAIDSNIIESDKKGKINYTTEVVKWYEHENKSDDSGNIVDPSKSFNPNDIPQYIKDLANSEHLSFEQLYQLPKVDMDKLKIYEQIKQIRVKTKKERKELIDSKFIKIVLGKLYEIDINEFMEIKTRMKPHFSKVFKTNDDKTLLEAEGILDKELWETLKRIKFEIDKFIDKWSDKKK